MNWPNYKIKLRSHISDSVLPMKTKSSVSDNPNFLALLNLTPVIFLNQNFHTCCVQQNNGQIYRSKTYGRVRTREPQLEERFRSFSAPKSTSRAPTTSTLRSAKATPSANKSSGPRNSWPSTRTATSSSTPSSCRRPASATTDPGQCFAEVS